MLLMYIVWHSCVCLGVYGSYVELMYQSLSKPFDIIYANAPHTHTHMRIRNRKKKKKVSHFNHVHIRLLSERRNRRMKRSWGKRGSPPPSPFLTRFKHVRYQALSPHLG